MSEERIVPTAAEFASAASQATNVCVNVLQALLVACVVLWVLDIPRQFLDLALYSEQLLVVCLGLTLALAFLTEQELKPRGVMTSGAIVITIICAYIAYRHSTLADVPPALLAGLALTVVWTFIGWRPWAARWFDWASAAASLAICAYVAIRYHDLTTELAELPVEGIIGCAFLTFLVLEGSRRVSGFGFVGIILAMGVYIFISPHFSGDFQTRPVSPERLVAYLGLDTNSIFGSILAVAVLIVIPFTIMGQVLAKTGGATFFSDLAMSSMGRFRGGSAKIAVVGSALFGMISGSAVSNVVAVGIVTIPTMIRSGFSRYKAAAIESVGSTGGQLMPPVMGAAAFIMAEFLQVSYGAVCIAAAIPAILYYACLFIHVDLDAAKMRIGAAEDQNAPPLREVLLAGWHFLLPIGFLIFALIYPGVFPGTATAEKTAITSTGMLMVLAVIFGYRGQRISIQEMLMSIIETGRISLDIILIGAAAGIMVGILSISGLSFSLTLQLLALSGKNVYLLLLLIAALAFVLGIGLPTVSVYILTATLLAPGLVELGVTPMAAHMFVMYNGMLSMITPPVAFAAYAAANIARVDGWTTGWIACLVGWSTFILPFLFVLTPSLLMYGPVYLIVFNFARILFALFIGTAGIVGYALTPLGLSARLIYGLVALPIAMPPEVLPGGYGYYVNALGIAAGIVLLAIDHMRRKAAARELVPASKTVS